MKILVAIVSCHALEARRAAIRSTWLPELASLVDYKFIVGKGPVPVEPDVLQLDADDSYAGLPAKTREISRYALAQCYTHVFKCDDDVYVQPGRLLASKSWELGNYVGRKRGPSGNYPAPYASGFSYWLDETAMKVIASAPLTEDQAEDRWVANTLFKVGIQCSPDYRYVVLTSKRNATSGSEGPRQGNNVITACEMSLPYMSVVHGHWLGTPTLLGQKQMPADPLLSKVSILVKTFLRDGFMSCTVNGIQNSLPEAKIIVVDDGYEASAKITYYSKLRERGHVCLWLPFDSGFGAKSNAGVEANDREFLLIASDDFIFNEKTREDVKNMVRVLLAETRD